MSTTSRYNPSPPACRPSTRPVAAAIAGVLPPESRVAAPPLRDDRGMRRNGNASPSGFPAPPAARCPRPRAAAAHPCASPSTRARVIHRQAARHLHEAARAAAKGDLRLDVYYKPRTREADPPAPACAGATHINPLHKTRSISRLFHFACVVALTALSRAPPPRQNRNSVGPERRDGSSARTSCSSSTPRAACRPTS